MLTIAPISNATTGAASATPAAALTTATDGATGSARKPFVSVLAQSGLSKPDAPAASSAPSGTSAGPSQTLGRDLNLGRQAQKPESAANTSISIFNLAAMNPAWIGIPFDLVTAQSGVKATAKDTSQGPGVAAPATLTAAPSSASMPVTAAISQLGDGSAVLSKAILVDAQKSNAQADMAATSEANSSENSSASIQTEQSSGAGKTSVAASANDANTGLVNDATRFDSSLTAIAEPLPFTQGAQTDSTPQNPDEAKANPTGNSAQASAKAGEAPGSANSINANVPGNASTLPATIFSTATPAGDRTAGKSLIETLNRLGGSASLHAQTAPNAPATANILPPLPESTGSAKTAGANPAAVTISKSAQNPATPASNSASGATANHSDNSSNSGGNTQKNSNSDAAAEVKAAGLASTSGDQSSHAPADAPAQSAGAAAGTAAAMGPGATNSTLNALNSGSSSAAILTRPEPFPAANPQSLSDVVKASELYQRVGGAEIHISMDTDLLGSIDVRAVVHQSTLTATIGVERADVQTMLANELPALQHSLSEQSLHINEISVMSGSIGARSDLSGNSQPQHHAAQPHYTSGISPLRETFADFDSRETPLEALLWNGGEERISIHV